MKTTLKKLEMKGLRSFVDPCSITFPENGLVLLMGPSGSGKSSVFLGIAHALGNCPYSATELQSWYGDEKLEVKLDLSTNAGDVTIVRGPKSFVEGAVNIQGASNLNSTIMKLTGLDQELLAALTYRPQKTAGLFLSKTNSEMQEFLSILLGLNKFDTAIEQCQEHIKEFEVKLEAENLILPRLKQQFDDAGALVEPGLHDPADFQRQVKEASALSGKLMGDLQLQIEKIKDFRAEWKKKSDTFQKEKQKLRLDRPISGPTITTTPEIDAAQNFENQVLERVARLTKQDEDRRAKIAIAIKAKNAELRELTLLERKVEDSKQEHARLQAEIASMEAAVCPKCEQQWVNAKAKAALAETTKRASELFSFAQSATSIKNQITAVENEIAGLNEWSKPDPRIAQMQEIYQDACRRTLNAKEALAKAQADERVQEEQAVQAALAAVMDREKAASDVFLTESGAMEAIREALQNEYNVAENAWNQAKLRLSQIEGENKAALKERERIIALKETTKLAYENSQNKIKNLGIAIKQEQDLLEMLKAFLTAIFDEVLEEIAWNTNEMLAQVPNVAHITLKFKTETTTQKGKVKRALTPVVNIGGGERPLRSALSGGMSSAVELAVDLAVRKVISARSGAIPGWLVLDECFEGLGVAEKEACLEILKRASEDTLILVIDHSSETKELFNRVIEIENINGRSKITEG